MIFCILLLILCCFFLFRKVIGDIYSNTLKINKKKNVFQTLNFTTSYTHENFNPTIILERDVVDLEEMKKEEDGDGNGEGSTKEGALERSETLVAEVEPGEVKVLARRVGERKGRGRKIEIRNRKEKSGEGRKKKLEEKTKQKGIGRIGDNEMGWKQMDDEEENDKIKIVKRRKKEGVEDQGEDEKLSGRIRLEEGNKKDAEWEFRSKDFYEMHHSERIHSIVSKMDIED